MNEKYISGITTNPTLMRKSGVTNYELFAKSIISNTSLPLSLEVFSDDFDEMIDQAKTISNWGEQVYVKIPVTNTKGISTSEVIRELVKEKIKVNITAILSKKQIKQVIDCLDYDIPSIVSIFSGRIADTGQDPCDAIAYAIASANELKKCEILWASTREIYNYYQAVKLNCDIITIPPELLKKLKMQDMNLEQLSLDTVKMFYNDACASKYSI